MGGVGGAATIVEVEQKCLEPRPEFVSVLVVISAPCNGVSAALSVSALMVWPGGCCYPSMCFGATNVRECNHHYLNSLKI